MNKARTRQFQTKVEKKNRDRSGHEATLSFNKFKGFYKNNERGN